ncbi:MAG: peptide chain release factor 2 [Lachnospiraceae bacterium]|nr:peptide chain release factor 2 [Lachnospiraceae bacterium]MCI7329698.1 peptide chain release factor 2 [Lachnospiraceae bacterium]MDD7701512.1 peptide chain release factor 2 [Lachnospiraceae bacterium]MDY3301944.1 peptide chain release factor 2 [Lachnospiraceae bacterium]
MVELDNLRADLTTYKPALEEAGRGLDLENKDRQIEELEREMAAPDFWDDPQVSTEKTRKLKSLKDDVSTYYELEAQYQDILDLIELANEEDDRDMIEEVEADYAKFKEKLENLQTKTLLSGEYDDQNAIITLHAGAGGTEACDWTSMLYRMYTRWADQHGFQVEVLDTLEGDEAGLKSVTFQINGENAYGLLKSEHGVHRLVRISPFNANAKRQTSFSSCEVMPDIEKDLDVEVRDDDIRIDTYRSSGAGGQHINKTSSAIRITHFPSGIVVTCQNERSQLQNKDKAMQMLKQKLFMLKEQENAEKEAEIRGEVMENGFGSQIRSYVLQPYTMVKDLRTGEESGNAQKVLDGDLDQFLRAYLRWLSLGKPKWKGVDAE